jgi:diaminohydroxyphosphoribosylaminopyrimidine deaminase/5-amino-6-(5-phosphoribosylamino)uracil reductase
VSAVLATDHAWLTRAIDLAELGRAGVSPNPLVGAVVVRDGELLGEGHHRMFGGPHAERDALAACDEDTAGATMYVSLEPCCHHGKTPPCTDAIMKAGIARVVVASDDPSEKASGRGLGILRDEGIHVDVADGELAARARLLNQAFRKHGPHRPAVGALQVGDDPRRQGRDQHGRLEVDLRRLQPAPLAPLARRGRRGRRRDRHGAGRRPAAHRADRRRHAPAAPRRVRLRGAHAGRLPARADGARDPADRRRLARRAARGHDTLEMAGAEVIVATGENEPARVRSALDQLGAAGVSSILLEGGPHLAGAFFDAGEVDDIRLFLAPVVLGGASARDPLEGEGAERIADATRALTLDVERVGEDLLVHAMLRQW